MTPERVLAGPTSRERGLLVGLVLLAFLLRAGVVLEYEARHPLAGRPVIDEAAYEERAVELARGGRGAWLGDEVFFQEPLYPYALGVLYAATPGVRSGGGALDEEALARARKTARRAQAALGAAATALVWLLTRAAFGSLAALVAAAGWALYRPLLLFPALLLKPNLFLPLALVLLLALLRARRTGLVPAPASGGARALAWAVVGLLIGLCALVRGNALVLVPALLAAPFLMAPRPLASAARDALALFVGCALVVAPVAARNLVVGGVFALVTVGGGPNVYLGNHAENPHGRAAELSFVRGIPRHEPDDWRREAERRTGRALDPAEVDRYWLAEALRELRAEPWAHLEILWAKLRLSLSAHELADNHSLAWDARFVPLLRVPWPGFALQGALGLAGLVLFVARGPARAPPRDDGAARVLAWAFVLYLATIVATVVSMRIRLGLLPMLLPFAGYWVASLVRALAPAPASADSGRERPRIAYCAGALSLALVPVLIPVLSAEERREDLDKRDFNHAVYLLERPDGLEEAAALARSLAARYPDSARTVILAAEIDFRRGVALRREGEGDAAQRAGTELLGGALASLRAVLERPGLAPREAFRARSLAALIQLEAGHPAAAVRSFRAARAFDPDDRVLRLGLANALWLTAQDPGRPAERAALLRESEALLEALLAEPAADAAALRERLALVRAARAESD